MKSSSSPRIVSNAGALVIGGELLSGKVRDENIQPLARALRSLGIRLTAVALVGDDENAIALEVKRLRQSCEVLFTSGGVGPTHDDVSVRGVARGLDRKVILDPTLVNLLQGVYGDRLGEEHLLMAQVPEGAELLRTSDIRWPTVVCDGVWMFPGVPDLFRMKLATIRHYLAGPAPIYGSEILSSAEELTIKQHIDAVVLAFPGVEVGSYPKWFDERFKTRITFDSTDQTALAAAAEHLRQLLGELWVAPLETDDLPSPDDPGVSDASRSRR